MKTRAVILAGGEGSRLSVLTAKRTKPAVPFAGKYRIIDFTLSNCVNSGIVDVMVLAQYRPHSLIDHIGAGGPWDLNRDFTGGVRIYTPYTARFGADWFGGTADAVQQNFTFIKQGSPELVLILSGDHIYKMDYDTMITFHLDHQADVTLATIRVPMEEAARFGIVEMGGDYRIISFIEKPKKPSSNLVNMGVYLFNLDVLNRVLWEDHDCADSSHDFGKDIIQRLLSGGVKVFAFPYSGYWMDVGTMVSYWRAHMDLLSENNLLQLNDRSWVIHTRTEERPPVQIARGASIQNCMISDGCVIGSGACLEQCVLSPGVIVKDNAIVRQSVLLTDCIIEAGAVVEHTILDKRVQVGEKARVGSIGTGIEPCLTLIGKNSILPAKLVVEPGAVINPDIIPSDFDTDIVKTNDLIYSKRRTNEM